MQEAAYQPIGDTEKTAALRQANLVFPHLSAGRRIGCGGSVQKRQAQNSLRRPAHQLEGDIAAEGQSGDGESFRRPGQDRPGDARKRIEFDLCRGDDRVRDIGEVLDLVAP